MDQEHVESCPNGTPYREIDPETWPGVLVCGCEPGDCPGAEPEWPEPQPVAWMTINGIDVPVCLPVGLRWDGAAPVPVRPTSPRGDGDAGGGSRLGAGQAGAEEAGDALA